VNNYGAWQVSGCGFDRYPWDLTSGRSADFVDSSVFSSSYIQDCESNRLLLLPLVKPQPRDGGWLKMLQRPTNMDLIGMYYSNLGCLKPLL
jgi:hypothetical protein